MHPQSLRILHCLRAPVGGLFRHVVDLATAQAELGARVGVVCAAGGDGLTDARLLGLAPTLELGLHRLPMTRDLGLADVKAWRQVVALARSLDIDILHGHGAKGGAYARLAARSLERAAPNLRCFYTPHGGSLHYPPTTLPGMVYGTLERHLEAWTDGILFESRYAAGRYEAQIGRPRIQTRVVTNGLLPGEFADVAPAADAADFVFVGELRLLKGVDVALQALAAVNRTRRATAIFVGDGPDATRFKAEAQALGLDGVATFPGAMPARAAFALGRVLVMPSRAESLPYIVLEAAAAALPMIATNVGGIPEIVSAPFGRLLPAGDVEALQCAMLEALQQPVTQRAAAKALQASVRERFSVKAMAAAVTEFYMMKDRARKAA